MLKRQFKKLLNDINYEYDTLLMYNSVRLLSQAISLDKFVNCLEEICLILHNNKTDFKELYNSERLTKFMFFIDVT